MKKQLTIIKVGGAIIEDEVQYDAFAEAFCTIEDPKILVHGGGRSATRLAGQLGIETTMVEGRRITDDKMIDVAVMTYAGLVNKKLVARLQARGTDCLGLTGADGHSILSAKRPLKNGIDYGWVGDIKQVNSHFFDQLLGRQLMPVLAPITYDGKGNLLNTNADSIASEVAVALSEHYEVTLNFVFDQKGVLLDINDPYTLVKSINQDQYRSLKAEGKIFQGMVPKLDNAFDAIRRGVSLVRLLHTRALPKLKNVDFDEFTAIH